LVVVVIVVPVAWVGEADQNAVDFPDSPRRLSGSGVSGCEKKCLKFAGYSIFFADPRCRKWLAATGFRCCLVSGPS
jgi:hypothetical protein